MGSEIWGLENHSEKDFINFSGRNRSLKYLTFTTSDWKI